MRKEEIKNRGFFLIQQSYHKSTFELKGDFNSNNIHKIIKALRRSKSSKKDFIELDMKKLETIDIKAMALFIITLKELKESGVKTKVTGLDGKNLNLAEELGIKYITQIN